MPSVWHRPQLAEAIMGDGRIFDQTQSIVADIVSDHVQLTDIMTNMSGVLTHSDPGQREKGMKFYTKLLKEIPKDYLSALQIQFIATFYVDRLKDHHCVIPAVIEGYLIIVEMKNYDIKLCGEFLTALSREVSCQRQLRQDRYNIYTLIKKLLELDINYMKSLGTDFVYGVISIMDGERDPRNLVLLFTFLPYFLKYIPLGHLVEEMFDVISCYYPIDFHPSPDDPAAVTRDNLADLLRPCLCATPEFGEHCLVLLVEKLDSTLRTAKLDSLKLLTESCKVFSATTYGPFLKALWSSISKDLNHKTDQELKMVCHETLSSLVAKLATVADTDQMLNNFVKGILITSQTSIAEATTVAQFVNNAKILLTTANASKESCVIIAKNMIPSVIAYYEFKTTPKLQIASLDLLGDLYDVAKSHEVLDEIKDQTCQIPELCLTSVSQNGREYQIAGFKTLIRVRDVLTPGLLPAFVDVLTNNIQYSQDNETLAISVAAIHAIARKYPEMIMNIVVKEKCHISNLCENKPLLKKRLSLLTNLASIDDFTKVIIEEMLRIITNNKEEAPMVVEALNNTISTSNFYTPEKVTQIESDHGIIDPILSWMVNEISEKNLQNSGYTLITNTISSLPAEKQHHILTKHTPDVLQKCMENDIYFLILECLYTPLHHNVYSSKFEDIMTISVKAALESENDLVRNKGCILVAHLLNKAESGQRFELLYELLKTNLAECSRDDSSLCPKLLHLYGWITKALLMRNSDKFLFWLQKIVAVISVSEYCHEAAEAIRLIMKDFPDILSAKQHCRISVLYKQRMYVSFSELVSKLEITSAECKEAYLLSWAYVLEKTPKNVLNNDASKVALLMIDSLMYENNDMLVVVLDVLDYIIKEKPSALSMSLQTLLPRLVSLTKYTKSMDVRIKSLECIYDIANTFRTALLLPYKQDILLDLAPSLDDKKRLVRNVAVRARTRWFLVGAPGEDKPN